MCRGIHQNSRAARPDEIHRVNRAPLHALTHTGVERVGQTYGTALDRKEAIHVEVQHLRLLHSAHVSGPLHQ